MQRITSTPRIAAQFSLAFISVEIRLMPARRPRPESAAERAHARSRLDRAIQAERRQAQTRLLLHG
jgi:hypothetical protein